MTTDSFLGLAVAFGAEGFLIVGLWVVVVFGAEAPLDATPFGNSFPLFGPDEVFILIFGGAAADGGATAADCGGGPGAGIGEGVGAGAGGDALVLLMDKFSFNVGLADFGFSAAAGADEVLSLMLTCGLCTSSVFVRLNFNLNGCLGAKPDFFFSFATNFIMSFANLTTC